MPQNTVISVKDLVKDFGDVRALDKLNLEVAEGEVHGFLGPNGSGKSTTIRILLGLLTKNSGETELLGQDPWKDAVSLHQRIAYVPGDVNLWPQLTGGESIDLIGNLRGGLDEKKRAMLLDRFQLDPRKKFRTYSKGNRQKVALVAALASDVELYILDEPTSGLDPLMEAAFQQSIKELKSQGKTVLLSSHILAEVEALCDKVTIIRGGQTVQSGTLQELRHLHTVSIQATTREAAKSLKLPGIHNLKISDDKHGIEFEVESSALDKALAELSKQHITSLVSQPPSLEELFLSQYDTNHTTKT